MSHPKLPELFSALRVSFLSSRGYAVRKKRIGARCHESLETEYSETRVIDRVDKGLYELMLIQ